MSDTEDNVPEINIDETPPQVDIKPVEFTHREPKGLAELTLLESSFYLYYTN